VIELNEGYREILNAIASDSPTPGGGSVAALSLAHAHALVCMVARLTLKSSKWESGHVTAEKAMASSDAGISDAIDLAHRDAESFDSVILAFKMPKSTEDEISERQAAISQGYIGACKVPMETAESGLELLRTIGELKVGCNANALSDLVAATILARTAIDIAEVNIHINLLAVPESERFEDEEVGRTDVRLERIQHEAARIAEESSEIITKRMEKII